MGYWDCRPEPCLGLRPKPRKGVHPLTLPRFALRGEAAGNFYKCGDRTETPHYLAWAKLSCDHPDYHRRQDFGTLRFEE